MNLDGKDIRVLKAIADDETTSPERISELTGIPKSTVHYRINALRQKDIIQNDYFDIDLAVLEFDITFIIEIQADYSEVLHETIGESLLDIEGVTDIYLTAGDSDFCIIAHPLNKSTVESLVTELGTIEDVQRTKSNYTVSSLRDGTKLLQQFSTELLIDHLST